MKKIRTKVPVLLDAQNGSTGIVSVTIREFTFKGNAAVVHLSYNEQVEVVGAAVGELKYNYTKPLPIRKGNTNINQERNLLSEQELEGLWQMIGASILDTGSFCTQLSDVLVTATIMKMVMDKNYRKIDVNNQLSELTMSDWEVIDVYEVVE